MANEHEARNIASDLLTQQLLRHFSEKFEEINALAREFPQYYKDDRELHLVLLDTCIIDNERTAVILKTNQIVRMSNSSAAHHITSNAPDYIFHTHDLFHNIENILEFSNAALERRCTIDFHRNDDSVQIIATWPNPTYVRRNTCTEQRAVCFMIRDMLYWARFEKMCDPDACGVVLYDSTRPQNLIAVSGCLSGDEYDILPNKPNCTELFEKEIIFKSHQSAIIAALKMSLRDFTKIYVDDSRLFAEWE